MIFTMLAQGKDTLDVATYLPMAQMRDPNAKEKIESFMQRMGITNGQLTRDQFSQFIQEAIAQRQAARAAANPGGQTPDAQNSPGATPQVSAEGEPIPEDKRPVVYRAGNLPKDIPSWFTAMDTDKDGQVGLYEWKAQGRPQSEFQALDLNGDGFITVEEAMRTVKKAAGTAAAASGAPFAGFNGAPAFGGAPSFGGPQPNGANGGQPGNRGNRGNRPG